MYIAIYTGEDESRHKLTGNISLT